MNNQFVGLLGDAIFFFKNFGLWLLIPSLILTIYLGVKVAKGLTNKSYDNKPRVGRYIMGFTFALIFTVFLIAVAFSIEEASDPNEVRDEVTAQLQPSVTLDSAVHK